LIKEFLYQNKKIFYHSTGKGKPVMFVHGFGEESSVWNKQAAALENNYKLIIPDLPGSGKSEMIDDMSMDGMAEVLHEIIHKECYEEETNKDDQKKSGAGALMASPEGGGREGVCTVIGHSMGGYIALALAENYWNHVNAFGLFHSTAFADSEEKKAVRKKGIEFIKQHGAFEFLKTTTPNLFSPETKTENPELIIDFIKPLSQFSPEVLIAYYEAMMQRPDRVSLLENKSCPVLFIAGKYDAAIPLNDVLKQCHLPEKSYFHILKKSGHMGMMEEPLNANRILEEFLSSL
jgi:pimeloyl-ACP methyl ester carboxylesterase